MFYRMLQRNPILMGFLQVGNSRLLYYICLPFGRQVVGSYGVLCRVVSYIARAGSMTRVLHPTVTCKMLSEAVIM